MNNKLVELLKEKPLIIPRVLLKNYKTLGISDEELIIISVIMEYGDKVTYDPESFAKEINANKHDVMKIINSLIDRNILSFIVEKSNRKTCEYISIDVLYNKLYNIVIGKEDETVVDDSVFSVFESELGRMLSPMEIEKIKEWITSGNSNELILCALNEAVLKGVNNLNYIDSILNSWKKKGYKNKEDIKKEKETYRNKKENVQVFDTDWLNE